MTRIPVFLVLAAGAALSASAQKRDVKIHNPPTLNKPTGYSHIVEINSGKLVYIAGQIAADKDGNVIGKWYGRRDKDATIQNIAKMIEDKLMDYIITKNTI